MIEIIDSFLCDEDSQNIEIYCKNCSFKYGEKDRTETKPTGMISNIKKSDLVFKLFKNKLEEKNPILSKMNLYRMYINCFSPGESPYFHTDGTSGITFLYYPNSNWNIDEGGETQFLIENEIRGILPIKNRLIYFSADILHRATSFRNNHRFSIAIKYD